MPKIPLTITTEINLDIETAAGWFAGLDDEQQADFFIKVAAIAKTWPRPQCFQWHNVGRHLQTCKCSTFEARQMIEDLCDGVKFPVTA